MRVKEIMNNSSKSWSIISCFKNVIIICFTVSIIISIYSILKLNTETSKTSSAASAVLPDNHVVVSDPNRLCVQNQYAKSLSLPLEDYARLADDWFDHRAEYEKNLTTLTIKREHNWDRFDAFKQMGSCNKTCIGGKCGEDASKIACGVEDNQMEAPCVVYSIGGNNRWSFEDDIIKKTPCEVHTFDCTGRESRFDKREHPRSTFHYVCLGSKNKKATKDYGEFWTLEKIQKTLGHNVIDLLKVDIEGYEFPMFESWPTLTHYMSSETALPMQVLVEVHYQTHMPELGNRTRQWKFGTDMINLQARFLNMGYAVVVRDDNKACRHCTELTLVRFRCPPTVKTIE